MKLTILITLALLTGTPDSSPITEIRIEGLSTTREETVRRELRHHIGETFREEIWQKEKARFESMDIFATSELTVTENNQGTILTYGFTELPFFIPFIAMKVTDQNGWMAGPAIAFLNMLGRGIRLELFARATIVPEFFRARELLFTISNRWIGSLPLEYDVFIVYNDLYNSLKLFDETSVTGNFDFFYRLTPNFKILATTEFYWVREDQANQNFTAGAFTSPLFLGSENDYWVKLGFGASYDCRDRTINPHNGIYQEVRFSQYGGFLGGPADYREVLFDFRGYYTAFSHHIFHLSLLGQYRPGTMGAYDFYHVGGTNTLRTYSPEPEFFGQHEFLATFEYRWEIIERLNFTLFGFNLFFGLQWVFGTDQAVLWDSDDTIGMGRYYGGYFTGAHLLFPGFRRMRIEFGIHGDETKEAKVAFGFTFGLWEKATVQRWRVR
jgi:outer membrane protein assembly factor BamA